eukprot:876057-Heterocapsa_arctica.AAC.1
MFRQVAPKLPHASPARAGPERPGSHRAHLAVRPVQAPLEIRRLGGTRMGGHQHDGAGLRIVGPGGERPFLDLRAKNGMENHANEHLTVPG